MTQKLFNKDCLIEVHDKVTGTGVLLDISRLATVGMVYSEVEEAKNYLVNTFGSIRENIILNMMVYNLD